MMQSNCPEPIPLRAGSLTSANIARLLAKGGRPLDPVTFTTVDL